MDEKQAAGVIDQLEITRLRAEVEKLRRVRDAAEAYRSVSTLRGYAPAQAAWETLRAALDAAKEG